MRARHAVSESLPHAHARAACRILRNGQAVREERKLRALLELVKRQKQQVGISVYPGAEPLSL